MTAAKSTVGRMLVATLSTVSAAGVGFGADGTPEVEYWDPREVNFVTIAGIASAGAFVVVVCTTAFVSGGLIN